MSEGRARDMSEDATNEQSGSARRAVFWRGLEELADTPDFRSFLHREFPRGASEWVDSPSRREFLKLMAASFALAGLTACGGETPEKIVPPVYQPEQRTPGLPLYYATALPLGGYARGVVVTSREGRPIKIEGNPQHPASLGATDAFGQASILSLYDPDRAQAVTSAGTIRSWDAFLGTLTRELAARDRDGGAGLRILTETVTSPTLAAQLRALLARYPNARWHHYEPLNDDNARAGIRLAFDQEADSLYRFDKARVILALDADFLLTPPGHLAYARQFTAGRRVRAGRSEMNRLYVAEATPTITGAMADHRLPLRAGEVATLTRSGRTPSPHCPPREPVGSRRSCATWSHIGGRASSSRATSNRRSSTPWRRRATRRSAISGRRSATWTPWRWPHPARPGSSTRCAP